uniref:Bromo domain-containing protein n=1 Tax=Mola mola TaxID=94237 RepID=A0A3Q4B4I8_MOLML
MFSLPKWAESSSGDTDLVLTEDGLCNGTCEVETEAAESCTGDIGAVSAEGDGMSELSNSDLSLPEICISTCSNSVTEDMNYEVQQAYRIFSSFLLDKHKSVTGSFLHPIGHQQAQHGVGGVRGWGHAQLKQSMCLRRMEDKFSNQEYETITEFVADFRLMLENCYRYHGVDHWISKQAQKLEIMLEQKLTLLSRTLREKTTLAVTSKGRFGAEEERGSGGTSTRRRLAPRSLATITVGGHESIMVQTLRLEEQQRAKDEKRQRELEKKEAEEMSAKEVEEWEQTLLSQASPHTVDTVWELPAIGHFLCLAQTALNLPEIIFFELERCLLMPRCSPLLSKIMSSLLSPPQRRVTLHRRPALPYRRWESELRQRVMGWYQAVGSSHNQAGRAEQLGLCRQFFGILGEVSPLEEKPFHLLPFYQRVWLLKGLCDHVYETQKDVQDAVLFQPIHECRESILGYDSRENAYIHFPHFCGADLRIYCQSPSTPPVFPLPSLKVRKVEKQPGLEGDKLEGMKDDEVKSERGYCGGSMDTGESEDFGYGKAKTLEVLKEENLDGEEDSKKTQEPCLNVGEHSYTGRSPARPVTHASPARLVGFQMEERSLSQGLKRASCLECCKSKTSNIKSERPESCCHTSGLTTRLSSESAPNSSEERTNDKIWSKKKKRKKKQGREQLPRVKEQKHEDRMSLSPAEATKSAMRRVTTSFKRKDKKKKHKTGKKRSMLLLLVCTSLEELRELISKTEDELDDLESTKKRLGRWYYRREAVKDLHSTLIRLLNELSPWEPKLVKAFQRNRLRLKKEFDDFKRHPEYNNFVREECISSSSSSDDDDDDDDEERSLERVLTYVPPDHLNHPLTSAEKALTLLPRLQSGSSNITSSDCGPQSRLEPIPSNQSRDSNSAWVSRPTAQASTVPKPLILHPTTGLPKGYTPIPTLLAKSVGNKVTLMKRPVDYPGVKSCQTLTQNSTQLVCKVPNSLGHLVSTENSSPVKISVHPVMDQNNGEKIMQQVVILPSNFLINKNEEKPSSLQQEQQSKGIQVPVSKVISPLCMSTNVPGFTIPVQQVAPLKNARTLRIPSRSVSPRLQPEAMNATWLKGSQVCSSQTSIIQGVMPYSSPITNPCPAVLPEPIKSTDSKQELKTVCIRDSHSILVTTRGGNTGIVKVQKSSDQNALGSLPTSPVIAISPQFKAFLISKALQTSPSAPSQTPSTIPAVTSISMAQTQKQVSSVIKSPSTFTPPMLPTATGSIPLASQTSLPTSSQKRAIPSLTMIPQLGTSTTSASTTNTVTMRNDIKKHLGISPNRQSNMCPAQVTSTRQICPAQTSISNLARQPLNIQNGTGEESTFSLSPSQLALNKTQTSIPSTETTNTQFTTSGTGTIQQRIVINTSTPLPAGTQILLNNARFVVPPQGLGPGSHVLIIPTPASQQVPTASATITGASVPLQGMLSCLFFFFSNLQVKTRFYFFSKSKTNR